MFRQIDDHAQRIAAFCRYFHDYFTNSTTIWHRENVQIIELSIKYWKKIPLILRNLELFRLYYKKGRHSTKVLLFLVVARKMHM